MTSLANLLTPERVIGRLAVTTKVEALQQLAERAAVGVGLPADTVLQALLRREVLGSTAIGHGVAIPHAVLPGLANSFALFALTASPIAFEAVDGQPVLAIFMFLTPEDRAAESTHLLAQVCRGLRNPAAIPRLRLAAHDGVLHDALLGIFQPRRAA
jgi:PTS system nitrogen regulatory IIA component